MSRKLDATMERGPDGGWRIRVPLRREDLHVAKQTYVVEEVEIRREYRDEPDVVEPTRRLRTPVRPPR